MRNALLIGLCLGSLAAPSLAQTIGQPAPELIWTLRDKDEKLADKMKLVGKRGLIVVLYFFRTTDAASTDALEKVAKVGRIPGVEVIMMAGNKKEDVDKVTEAKDLSGATVIVYETDSIAELYDVSHYPRCYVIDPEGLIAWRGHPGELEARLKDQIRLTPPLGAGEEALKKKLDLAKKKLADKKVGLAFTLCRQVIDLTTEGDKLNSSALSVRDEIEKAAEKRIESAKKAFDDRKYQEAAEILAEIKVRLEGRDIIKTADAEIGRVRGSRDSKQLFEDALRDVRAEMLLETALEQLDLKRFVDAERQLRELTEKYDEAPAAKLAEMTLENIRKDPDIQKTVQAHYDQLQAERWYDIGDRFTRLGLPEQAREYFKKVVEKYPSFDAAKRAETAMKKLGSADKKKT